MDLYSIGGGLSPIPHGGNCLVVKEPGREVVLNAVSSWSGMARECLSRCDQIEKPLFQLSSAVCYSMHDSIEASNEPDFGKWNKLVACYDLVTQNILSVSCVREEEKQLFIEFLATRPDNLKSDLFPNRVPGAATEIIKYLAQQAFASSKTLSVNPNSDNQAFYEKVGFVRADGRSWEMTSEKISTVTAF